MCLPNSKINDGLIQASMWSRFTSKLYVRIWLAVVVTVAVLTFAVAGVWRYAKEPPQFPIRELVVRNEAGEVIGNAQSRPGRKLSEGLEFELVTTDGQTLNLQLSRSPRPPNGALNRPPFGFGFGWMLGLVGLAVALGSYPIIRRLTVRLEALQSGVERWGTGDLSTRLKADGNDEVAFLAQRFNQAAQRIETLMNSHKSLLANASHELRSPLARIRMALELSGPTANPLLRDELKRNIAELDLLIDEILLASRLDAREADVGTVEPVDWVGLAAEECARVDAELVVQGAVDAVRSDADIARQLVTQGIPRLLRRAVRNLLENARRHSGKSDSATQVNGSGIIAHLQYQAAQADQAACVVLSVSDKGPGVPASERERIFQPFYRLPGASERDGGVGLGLALVKSIVQRHHGSVHCEANPGGGARFVLRLPVV